MNSLLSGAQMLELDPNDIDDSGRIGFFYPDKAAALGRLMKVDGQRTPISVTKSAKGADKPWKLVVGKHRTAGARMEGIAKLILLCSHLLAQLRQIQFGHTRRSSSQRPKSRAIWQEHARAFAPDTCPWHLLGGMGKVAADVDRGIACHRRPV